MPVLWVLLSSCLAGGEETYVLAWPHKFVNMEHGGMTRSGL